MPKQPIDPEQDVDPTAGKKPPAVVQWPAPAQRLPPAQPPKPAGASTGTAPPANAPPPPPGAPSAVTPAAPPIGAAPPVAAPPMVAGTATPAPAAGTPGVFAAPPGGPVSGTLTTSTPETEMQDFQRVDSSNAPSDFVGFSEFAGLNDDQLRAIADRATQQSHAVRADTAGLLKQAQGEATADTPVEKTASYAKYLDAMSKAGDAASAAVTATGNPYEDALRGVYRNAQNARDDRDAAASANLGNLDATATNTYLATQKKLADERAAAEAEKHRQAEAAALARERLATAQEGRDARRASIKTHAVGRNGDRDGQQRYTRRND